MTFDLIINSQADDENATLFLIKKFDPLLKKYAFKLFYEDAYNDLLADFIELINNIKIEALHNKDEGGIVSYIAASIHNCYIKRLAELQKRPKCISYSNLSDHELYYLEVKHSVRDSYLACEISSIKCVLTTSEMSVINMLYFLGYTPAEIAEITGISRQAVNQMKNRALKKLNRLYSDKPCVKEAG